MGEKHAYVATSLENFAQFYCAINEYPNAAEKFLEALDIRRFIVANTPIGTRRLFRDFLLFFSCFEQNREHEQCKHPKAGFGRHFAPIGSDLQEKWEDKTRI